jgi:6-phosphogluconolactonase
MHSDHQLLNRLSRRTFLRSTTSLAALAQFRWVAKATVLPKQSTVAYIACRQKIEGRDDALQVFSLHNGRWAAIQRVPTRAPSCVVLSRDQQTLYVANHVDTYKGLPRGTVEAFRIDPSDGHLEPLSKQALSLSATYPRHMALSPDGRLLAVAADGGTIYNLLPVSEGGNLDRPCSIFKQLDCAPHTRFPAKANFGRLLFDTTGDHLLSSGFGNNRLSIFALAQNPMGRRMQQRAVEIDDLGACALHPDGSMLYVWRKRESSLSCYRYNSAAGEIGESMQRVSMPTYSNDAASLKSLAIHPSGRMLYATQSAHGRLQAWHISVQNGLLSQSTHIEFDSAPDGEMIVASNRDSLFVLDPLRGLISRVEVDSVTGELGSMEEGVTIDGAQSMAFKTL